MSLDKLSELKHLLTEPATEADILLYPTIGDAQRRISEILGRPVWSHELAYAQYLIDELVSGDTWSGFRKATADMKSRMPVIEIQLRKEQR